MTIKNIVENILIERIDFPLANNQLNILKDGWLQDKFGEQVKTTKVENGGLTIMKKVPGKTKYRPIAKVKVGPENVFYVSDLRTSKDPVEAENIPAVKNELANILTDQEVKEL